MRLGVANAHVDEEDDTFIVTMVGEGLRVVLRKRMQFKVLCFQSMRGILLFPRSSRKDSMQSALEPTVLKKDKKEEDHSLLFCIGNGHLANFHFQDE